MHLIASSLIAALPWESAIARMNWADSYPPGAVMGSWTRRELHASIGDRDELGHTPQTNEGEVRMMVAYVFFQMEDAIPRLDELRAWAGKQAKNFRVRWSRS
jgi:hypothetical protein